MAEILLRGLDWVSLNISFKNKSSLNRFTSETSNLYEKRLHSRVSFLGRNWTKIPHHKLPGRFELVSIEGLLLDIYPYRSGCDYPLKIHLKKPYGNDVKTCPLWEKPFETLEFILADVANRFGEIDHNIGRVDLFCHFSRLTFKSKDLSRFRGLPRAPWEHDVKFTGFSFKNKRPKEKRVEATIYDVNQRLADNPSSFDPAPFYPQDKSTSNPWNLEFKVYKTYLQERGINTIEDLKKLETIPSIWRGLTKDKVRLVVKSKDTNEARWKVNRHWVHIQKAFGEEFIPLKRITSTPKKLSVPKIIKCIETYLVRLASECNIMHLSEEDRVRYLYGCFDINRFSNEEILKYRHQKGMS